MLPVEAAIEIVVFTDSDGGLQYACMGYIHTELRAQWKALHASSIWQIHILCYVYESHYIDSDGQDRAESGRRGEGEVCRGGHHQPFIPLVVETTGVVGLKAQVLFEELGRQISDTTGEPLAH